MDTSLYIHILQDHTNRIGTIQCGEATLNDMDKWIAYIHEDSMTYPPPPKKKKKKKKETIRAQLTCMHIVCGTQYVWLVQTQTYSVCGEVSEVQHFIEKLSQTLVTADVNKVNP